jgi:transcriptional regulator with XRE-family HTH domain
VTKIHSVLAERFAANLKRELADRKLTHEVFAGKAKITKAYVSLLTSGERTPSLPMVEQCAKGLGIKDPMALLKEVSK